MPFRFPVLRAALAIALSAAALSSPVLAGEGRAIRVSTHGLDLADPTDVALLDARLLQAARNVCRRPSHASETALNQRTCVADTVGRAWDQIDRVTARQHLDSAHAAPHPAAG